MAEKITILETKLKRREQDIINIRKRLDEVLDQLDEANAKLEKSTFKGSYDSNPTFTISPSIIATPESLKEIANALNTDPSYGYCKTFIPQRL